MRKTTPPPCPPIRRAPAMTKREFMQQYILSRAIAKPDGMSGRAVAEEAALAWAAIERACAA